MIYLNNSSTTYPKPIEVRDSILKYMDTTPGDYGRQGNTSKSFNIVDDTRKLISKFFNASDDYAVIFTSGSTESINLFIHGLDLSESHVIITEIEHNSVIRPVFELHKSKLIQSFDIAECDSEGYVNPKNIYSKIKANTKLVIVNHCSNVTGTIQEIEEIVHYCNKLGILTIIDASQSAGAITIDITQIKCSAIAITGHKSLYGIAGIGALIFDKSIELLPLKYGGTGVFSSNTFQPKDLPYKLESGTQNTLGIAALNAGINWVITNSINNIANHKRYLFQFLIDRFKGNSKIKIFNPILRNSFSLFTFNINELDPNEVSFILESSFDIKVRSGLHCASMIAKPICASPLGTVRVSPSYFTSIKEIEIFANALDKIIQSV